MEHIEQAGVHSGDSSCVVPPWSLPERIVTRIKEIARALAEELRVCGLMNVQLAYREGEIYIIEVNPRASRTAPFVGKANGVPWPRVAALAMMGRSLESQGVSEIDSAGTYAVKAPVFPFKKFSRTDFVLGPEMRSTGEVMGRDRSLPIALAKAMMGAGTEIPTSGAVFLSVRDADKNEAVDVARRLGAMGFELYSTGGTADALARQSVDATRLKKIAEGARPNVLDLLTSGDLDLVINTPTHTGFASDEGKIRASAVRFGVPMITTITGAKAMVSAIEALRAGDWGVSSLQSAAKPAAEAEDAPESAAVPTA
jgi:carbamoyl-phosphate synthase large subunit